MTSSNKLETLTHQPPAVALPSFHERIPVVCTYLGLAMSCACQSTLHACSGICQETTGTNNPNCHLIGMSWSSIKTPTLIDIGRACCMLWYAGQIARYRTSFFLHCVFCIWFCLTRSNSCEQVSFHPQPSRLSQSLRLKTNLGTEAIHKTNVWSLFERTSDPDWVHLCQWVARPEVP